MSPQNYNDYEKTDEINYYVKRQLSLSAQHIKIAIYHVMTKTLHSLWPQLFYISTI